MQRIILICLSLFVAACSTELSDPLPKDNFRIITISGASVRIKPPESGVFKISFYTSMGATIAGYSNCLDVESTRMPAGYKLAKLSLIPTPYPTFPCDLKVEVTDVKSGKRLAHIVPVTFDGI